MLYGKEAYMKRVALISLLLIVSLLLIIVFFSTKDKAAEKLDYEKAAGTLYYLFWSEGEENVDKMKVEFQNDFHLSDSSMEELKQLSADYYFANSDLWYSMQNELASNPDASPDELDKINMNFKENSEILTQNYIDSISKILGDREKLINWMSKFITEDSAVQDLPHQ